MNKGVHPKASKSKLNADRPARSKYFNYKNNGGKFTSCCAVMGHKLLMSPGVADMNTFLMNTWNTLLESYQLMVIKHTLATVKPQIQQTMNPTPAMVISVDDVCVDNDILLDYLTSEVALKEPEIGNTDPNIPIDNNCTNEEMHFGMPRDSGEYEDEADKGDESDAFPTAHWRQLATTELESVDLGTSDFNGYEGEDGDDADEEEEASQANDGSMQHVEHAGHSTRECEDWTVYLRRV
jgi:hypothetical protein